MDAVAVLIGGAALILLTLIVGLLIGGRRRRMAEKPDGRQRHSVTVEVSADPRAALAVGATALQEVGARDIFADETALIVRGRTGMTFYRPALEFIIESRPGNDQYPPKSRLDCAAWPRVDTVLLTFGAEEAALRKLRTAIERLATEFTA
jgi:hypothetical protein